MAAGAHPHTWIDATIRSGAFDHLVQVDCLLLAFAGTDRLDVPAADRFTATIEDGRLIYAFRVPIRIAWGAMDDLVVGHFDQSYCIDLRTDA
ncbi:MAG: hypothetical protein ACOCZB_04335 [Spirochaetota bacterium]